MESGKKKGLEVSEVLFVLKWRLMTQILLALPVLGLFICLITSLIFHADHINNTICDVYNFLPSISAVTGVSPQRYIWRTIVAFHISPRLLVAFVAKEFYTSLASRVSEAHKPAFLGLVTIAFFLNLTELITLCGVTYISNKENYPVHEKLFMVFMIASLFYMLCVVRLLETIRETLSPILLRSLIHKKMLLGTKIAATVGLLFFFWRHRVHCQPKAFSWFSLCEYVIATCNMLYHVSVALDFTDEYLIVGNISPCEPFKYSAPLPVDEIITPVQNNLKEAVSSSCYSRFSGSSDSCSSFSSSTDDSSPSAVVETLIGNSDSSGSIKQVLSTIHENPECVLKSNLSDSANKEEDNRSSDLLSFQSYNPTNFSCLDKKHIE